MHQPSLSSKRSVIASLALSTALSAPAQSLSTPPPSWSPQAIVAETAVRCVRSLLHLGLHPFSTQVEGDTAVFRGPPNGPHHPYQESSAREMRDLVCALAEIAPIPATSSKKLPSKKPPQEPNTATNFKISDAAYYQQVAEILWPPKK